MTSPVSRRNIRPARHDSAPHLFAVGQSVRLVSGLAPWTRATGLYRIERTLPPMGDVPQYRIRNEDERHDRLASQDELEAANGEGATLARRTFGHD